MSLDEIRGATGGAHTKTAKDLTSACPSPGCQTKMHGEACFGFGQATKLLSKKSLSRCTTIVLGVFNFWGQGDPLSTSGVLARSIPIAAALLF